MSNVNKSMTAVEQTTKALVKVVADATKVLAQIGSVAENIPAQLDEVALLQGKLDVLSEEHDEKLRKSKADLALRVYENEDKVLTDLMKKRGFATITVNNLQDLEEQIVVLKSGNEAEVKKAVAIAVNAANQVSTAELLAKEAEWNVTRAELVAQERTAQSTIGMLEAQVAQLQQTIIDEREARIQIAQAEATKQAVTVNTSSK
ncbi:MAG: hypothetical protein ACRCR2_02475 [Fusobacteriaceae bacterium]